MLEPKAEGALKYIRTLIDKNSKMLHDNEKILSSRNTGNINLESVEKKIDSINEVLANLEHIVTVLEGKDAVDAEDKFMKIIENTSENISVENKVVKDETQKVVVRPKKESSNKGKPAPATMEVLRKIYPNYPDELIVQMTHIENDVIKNQIIIFVNSSDREVNINNILGNIYETLNIITTRDMILSICSKLFKEGSVSRGRIAGNYKKKSSN